MGTVRCAVCFVSCESIGNRIGDVSLVKVGIPLVPLFDPSVVTMPGLVV